MGKRQYKTFYEQDTELMFKESIKRCVDRAITQLTEERGIRFTNVQIVPAVQMKDEKSTSPN